LRGHFDAREREEEKGKRWEKKERGGRDGRKTLPRNRFLVTALPLAIFFPFKQ